MAEAFRVRRAEMRDMKAVFDLSNDPVVRAHSIHMEPIAWEKHVVWFDRTLTNPEVKFLVAESVNGQLIAQIRFNHEDEGWVVSVSMVGAFRGKGLGGEIIKSAVQAAGVSPVIAYIKDDNIASQMAFAKSGFAFSADNALGAGYICMKLAWGGGNSL